MPRQSSEDTLGFDDMPHCKRLSKMMIHLLAVYVILISLVASICFTRSMLDIDLSKPLSLSRRHADADCLISGWLRYIDDMVDA